MSNVHTINECADIIERAVRERTAIGRLTERFPSLTLEDGYAIQSRYLARRLQAGETIVGKKIGVTSKPVQDFLGVYEPDFGQLTSGMVCNESDGIDLNGDRKSTRLNSSH